MKLKLARIFIYLGIWLMLFPSAAAAQKEELKLEILNGHSGGGVLAVAVSTDGKFALTGSTDNTALLWDLETGKQLRRFVGHSDAVSAVAFSKDGTQVLTASYDKTARLWETATGRQTRVFVENRQGVVIGHSDKILTAAFSSDGRLVPTAGADKTARIWDAKTGTQLFLLEHEGRVNSIAFSPDSKYLLTGGEDKIARLYSTETGKEEKQFVGHTGEITSVAYSPDGEKILTGSKYNENQDKTNLWSVETTEIIKEFNFYDVRSLSFGSSGKKFVAANGLENGLFDIESGKEIRVGHGGYFVAWTPDENFVLSGAEYSNLTDLISIKTGEVIKQFKGESDVVNKVALSKDSHFILTGADGNTSGLWNLMAGLMNKFRLEPNKEKQNNFDPLKDREEDATFIRTSFRKYELVENSSFNSFRSRGLGCREGCEDESTSRAVDISPDGEKFAFANLLALRVFDLLKLKQENIFKIRGFTNNASDKRSNGISFLNFSSNGEYLIGGGSAGTLFWNIKGDVKINNEYFRPYDAIFSPDTKTIAAVRENLTLINVEDRQIKLTISDFPTPVWSVAFSPNGKTIAAASSGEVDMSKVGIGNAASANGVRLFDVETGKEIEGFDGEFKSSANKFTGFKSVAYSPDKEGRYIAAGSFDGKVYLRDNQTKELKKFEGHTDAVNSVKFAKDADGNLLVVSGSSDSTTRIWNAATGEEICALVTFRDGNWAVVQTKTGRYDAPNGGEIDGIQWVYGTETIELKQLSAMYYTPNLLPRLLGYNKDPLTAVVPLKDIKLFPEVVEQKFDARTNRLNLKLKSRGGGIGKTEIYAGGKLTGKDGKTTETEKLVVEDARDEKLRQNPNVANGEIVSLSIELPAGSFVTGGENQIKVVTSNYLREIGKGNIQSRGSQIAYLDEGKEDLQLPTLYAIVGGVSDYAGENLKLRFAAKDADDFSNALKLGAKRLFGVDKVNVTTLSTERTAANEQPTKENFKRAVEDIAKKARPEDIVLIYLTGHGVTLGGGTDTYFYLTKDARSTSKTDLETNFQTVAISNAELVDWLTPDKDNPNDIYIKALKQVVILDTCAAGSFAAEDWRKDREGLTGDQIRAMEFLKNKTGTFVLMGSAANAVSYEANTYNQGLLTYSLLEGMKGLALQKPTENIDVRLLFDYAEKRVPELAKTMNLDQRPLIKQPSGNTFVIGQMSDAETAQITIPQPKPLMLRPLLTAPPLGNDPLKLIPQLGKLLDAESSYAVVRQRGEKEPKLIYIDDDNFPGAVRLTGTYAVAGEIVKVKAYLVRDETVLAELPEIVSTKEKVLDELLEAVRLELAKITVK